MDNKQKEKINNYNIMIKGKKPFPLGKVKKCRLKTILFYLLYYGIKKNLGLPKNIIFIDCIPYYANDECDHFRRNTWSVRYGLPKSAMNQFKLIEEDDIRALLYYYNVKVNVIMPFEFRDLKMTENGELLLFDGW
jgi:hypothetical protein